MSTPYVPAIRRPGMIGCNIRNGITPGGFSHKIGRARRRTSRACNEANYLAVKEAASAVLEKRGFINEPTTNDSTARSPTT